MMAYCPLRAPSLPPVPQAALPSKIVKESASDLAGLDIEVAVIVGVLFGAAGTLEGGVKSTLNGFANESVPQAGEHVMPLAVRVQLTPELMGSFCIVALNWALKREEPRVPAENSVTLFWMVTTVAGTTMAMADDFEGCATEVAVSVTVRSEGIAVGAL